MAVNDRDPAWAVQADNRAKVADLSSGRDAALSYIRALPGHDEATAKAFRNGAYFLPVVARTAEAFGGLVFAKTPTRNVPSGLDTYLKDVTGSGQDMDRLAEQAFDAILQTGAVMVLVDYPSSDERLTMAQAEQRGLRPVLRLYDANAILAARLVQLGAARRPGQIRVREVIEVEGPDFSLTAVEQIRVLELVGGKYQQQVWREEKGEWKSVEFAKLEAKLAAERDDYKGRYEKLVGDRALKDALIEAKIDDTYKPAVEALLREKGIRLTKDGEAQINGQPVADFVKEWAASDAGKPFILNGNSGGGAEGGRTCGAKPLSELGDAERLQLAREGKLRPLTGA